jgi:hypothetical protein
MPNIKITKKADDPLGVVRVSVGGGAVVDGYYCVYRGKKEEAIAALTQALEAMSKMAEVIGDREPDVQPDDGKQYA